MYADNARALDDCGTYNINCDILRRFAAPADGRWIEAQRVLHLVDALPKVDEIIE